MSLVVALFDRRITGHTLWFALFSLSLLFLSSCSGKQEAAQIPGGLLPELAGTELHLADLVSARPAAVVSSQSPLEIEFTRPLVPTHMVNHPSDHCPVHFTPSIEGSCTWLTQGLLRFQPAKPLPAGQSYQVLLKGKEAFGKDAKVDDYAFAFKVAEQEILSVDGDLSRIRALWK